MTITRRAFILAAIMTDAATAFASSAAAGHHRTTFEELSWPLVNFAIYLAIVVYGYKKKAAPAIRERSDDMRRKLERSHLELQAVERELSGIRARLANLEEEKRSLQLQLRDEGERMAQSIVDAARAEVRRAESDTSAQRAHSISRLQKEVTQELVKRSVARAQAKLTSGVTPDDDRRLRDEVLSSFVGQGR